MYFQTQRIFRVSMNIHCVRGWSSARMDKRPRLIGLHVLPQSLTIQNMKRDPALLQQLPNANKGATPRRLYSAPESRQDHAFKRVLDIQKYPFEIYQRRIRACDAIARGKKPASRRVTKAQKFACQRRTTRARYVVSFIYVSYQVTA